MNISGSYQPPAHSGNNVQHCQFCKQERKDLKEVTLDSCSLVSCLGCSCFLTFGSGCSWYVSCIGGLLCAEFFNPFISRLSAVCVNEYLQDRKCNHAANLTPVFNSGDSGSSSAMAADSAGPSGSVDDRPSRQPGAITVQPEETPGLPTPIKRRRRNRHR